MMGPGDKNGKILNRQRNTEKELEDNARKGILGRKVGLCKSSEKGTLPVRWVPPLRGWSGALQGDLPGGGGEFTLEGLTALP